MDIVFADMHRTRNGRLATNRISRRAISRWRMVRLDGEYYDRARLRAALADQKRRAPGAPPTVPHSRRRMTAFEIDDLFDPNPWVLFR